jgi:hypothetical protein
MAISIDQIPEPLSRASDASPIEFPFARSRAYDALHLQMQRYVKDELRGNSVLISGHRGAGKTRLVTGVVSALQKEFARTSGQRKRLLLVELHGPALAGEWRGKPDFDGSGNARNSGDDATDPKAKQDSQKLPLNNDYSDDERLLILIVVALHLKLLGVLADGFWNVAMRRQRASRDPFGVMFEELAAEFSRELDDFPTAARIREYWKRVGVLSEGVLFPPSAPPPGRRSQGMRELLLIASSFEAHRRVSGTFTPGGKEFSKASGDKNDPQSSELSFKNLIPAIVGILSGGAVGGGAIALSSPGWTAALLGLATVLVTAGILRQTAKPPEGHTLPLSRTWERDLTVRTLRRELPRLIERFIDAGVYPIFFIDELDKVEDFYNFERTLKQLKVIFSEKAFFCFGADRKYYEEILFGTRPGGYPKSATIYRHRVFVTFLPEDFHSYLADILRIVP